MAQPIKVNRVEAPNEEPQTTDLDTGEAFFHWQAHEHEKHSRGILWYLIVGVVSVFLLLWAIFKQENYLFAGIILITLIIIFITSRREPRQLDIHITEAGVMVNNEIHPWREFTKFWIAYNPPVVKKLYLARASTFNSLIIIPLADTNPLDLRNRLLEYLDEDLDEEGETTDEALSRLLKL